MRDTSIRVRQLRLIKRNYSLISLFFNVLFLIIYALGVLIEFLIMRLMHTVSSLREFIALDINLYILYVVIFLFIIYNTILYIRINKKYKNDFLKAIYNECKLDDVYFLSSSKNLLANEQKLITGVFNFKKFKHLNSFSDATGKVIINIRNIKFTNEIETKKGFYLLVDFDENINEYYQINKTGKYYDKIENIYQYGLEKSMLKGYILNSNNIDAYKIIDNEKFAKSFIALKKYLKSNIDFCFYNSSYMIFCNNFYFKIAPSILHYINNSMINDKIESLLTLHKLIMNLNNALEDIFLSK